MAGSDNFKIDYFLVGVPKSASTWIYQCCLDHPEITVPDEDSLKYFDLKHHKGLQKENHFLLNCLDSYQAYFHNPQNTQDQLLQVLNI